MKSYLMKLSQLLFGQLILQKRSFQAEVHLECEGFLFPALSGVHPCHDAGCHCVSCGCCGWWCQSGSGEPVTSWPPLRPFWHVSCAQDLDEHFFPQHDCRFCWAQHNIYTDCGQIFLFYIIVEWFFVCLVLSLFCPFDVYSFAALHFRTMIVFLLFLSLPVFNKIQD